MIDIFASDNEYKKIGGNTMPYIDQSRREAFSVKLISMTTPGDLNYQITQLCQEYRELRGESYQTYNDIMGALEGCKLELYRRKVSKYEDKKIKSNGDVYI